ncbi:hypothetical protein OF897_00015 [Chryseobacterium formosus]|uniref:Uncharacterized protein n=1 Tax=Chryseobacterium formosus TaxID=1537363 RepID=A0ABT3XJH0_9FLAO|nr:hypothetical protein [Chryseobacterium formosus]MCX8522305.1 hypothetical protein [Chryseobacterium formosus]
MKKNLFLRLCLILLVALTISSCRTDHLNENETYNNSAKFQLTSKRISLDESKHRSMLLPEIEKAEEGLKNSKTNINGKVINYGNGVSIDTDEVIYIENGPNFHTYTFIIKRENTPEDAPLENLLLVPKTDGGYKEFLVTYNFTPQEREKVRNGEPVNTNGKTTISELANGSFNSGGQLAKMTCNWNEETIYVTCSDNVHNASNVSQWPKCKADTPPGVYTIITGGCNMEELPEVIDYPGGPGGSGTGPGGNGNTDPGTPPDCTTVANNPSEVGITNPNGCSTGFPTQPSDMPPSKVNPCEKIVAENNKAKEFLAKPKASGRLAEVKVNISTNSNEKSFSLGVDSNGNEQVTPIFEDFSGTHVSIVAQSPNFKVKAGVHTHPNVEFAGPSAADVYTFIEANKINNDFDHYFTIAYEGSEYVYTITDQYLFDKFKEKYPPNTYLDSDTKIWDAGEKIGITFYEVFRSFRKQGKSKNEAYELAMAFVLKKYNSGIGLSKKDANGDFKPIFVEELKDPNNPKKSIYNKTDNCNL